MMGQSESFATKHARKPKRRDGLFQKNGWWWIDYYDAEGKRHRKKAAPDYKTATTIYRDTMTAVAKGEVLGVREEAILLRNFVDKRYWPTVKPTLAATWSTRSREILDRQILPVFGASRLSGIRQEVIERWHAARRGVVKASTANKELARLKHLLARAVAWGYLKVSPAAKVAKAKEAGGRVRYLSAEERHALLEGVTSTVTAKDGRSWAVEHRPSPELRLYILAALMTGARRGELLRLTWRDVDVKHLTVTFRETKNGHDRTVPLTPALVEALQALPRPGRRHQPCPARLQRPARSHPGVRSPRSACGRPGPHIPRSPTRRGQHPHHGWRVSASRHGAPGPSRSAHDGRYQHLAPGHLRDAMQALDRAVEPAMALLTEMAARAR